MFSKWKSRQEICQNNHKRLENIWIVKKNKKKKNHHMSARENCSVPWFWEANYAFFPWIIPIKVAVNWISYPIDSCNSYLVPFAHHICFTTRTRYSPFSFFSSTAYVIYEFKEFTFWFSPISLLSSVGKASAFTARG